MLFYGISGALILPLLLTVLVSSEIIPETFTYYLPALAILSGGTVFIPILFISIFIGFIGGICLRIIIQIIQDDREKV